MSISTFRLNAVKLPIILAIALFTPSICANFNDKGPLKETVRAFLDDEYSVNIETCQCQNISQPCQVSLSIPGNECSGSDLFCCKLGRNFTAPSLNNNTVRVRIRAPGKEDVRVTSLPPKMTCQCKVKGDCPDKDIDFTFGFHCAHDRVRCCQPMHKCVCLPRSGCREGGGTDDGEEDDDEGAQCPFNLVQCCGDSIIEALDNNKSEANQIEMTDTVEEVPGSLEEAQSSGVSLIGWSGSRQPIQLPVLKIPKENRRVSDDSFVPSPEDPYEEMTLAPPNLPSHYETPPQHQVEPTPSRDPQPIQYPASHQQLPPPPQGQRVYLQRIPPQNIGQNYPRKYPIYIQRPLDQEPSFFKSIVSMFGRRR